MGKNNQSLDSQILGRASLLILSLLFSTACTKVNFDTQKEQVLASNKVMADGTTDVTNTNVSQNGQPGTTTNTQVGQNPRGGSTNTQVGQNPRGGNTNTQTGQNPNGGNTETETGQNPRGGNTNTQTGQYPRGGNTNTQTGQNPYGGPTQTQTGQNPNGPVVTSVMMCSTNEAMGRNYGSDEVVVLKKALSNKAIPVSLKVNDVECSTDAQKIIDAMKAHLSKGMFDFGGLGARHWENATDLSELCPAVIKAIGEIKTVRLDVGGKINGFFGKPRTEDEKSALSRADMLNEGKFQILYAKYQPQGLENIADDEAADSDNCQAAHSPLAIRVGKTHRGIQLSSIADGIKFDLLGDLNRHLRVPISWFTNVEYGMLALPNSRGQVLGIDELFGNNTRGPDAKNLYADNGYAALAKHDANHDGRIDAKDAVFSKLRIWLDANYDGLAQESELMTLDEAEIVFIDLDFNKNYREIDAHGNEIKMKSVVGKADGSLDLIFDIWFKVGGR